MEFLWTTDEKDPQTVEREFWRDVGEQIGNYVGKNADLRHLSEAGAITAVMVSVRRFPDGHRQVSIW